MMLLLCLLVLLVRGLEIFVVCVLERGGERPFLSKERNREEKEEKRVGKRRKGGGGGEEEGRE